MAEISKIESKILAMYFFEICTDCMLSEVNIMTYPGGIIVKKTKLLLCTLAFAFMTGAHFVQLAFAAAEEGYTAFRRIEILESAIDSTEPQGVKKAQVNRTTGLFAYKGDEVHIAVVSPQVVIVLDRDENWLQISSWLGPMWINLDFSPPVCELNTLLARFGNNLSVFFENLETGFMYGYNSDRIYFSASVPKASFALYIYQKAEQGEIDLNNTTTFLGRDYNAGSGVIRHRYPVGSVFTQRELLRLNLSESDNIATLMLLRTHGIEGYRQFISYIGGTPSFVGDRIMNSQLTANEAGLFAKEIYRYIESEGVYSDEFKEHLLNNQFPFIVSDYPVASKTGWTRPIAWHDMAIVYAPSPYILVILSARNGWSYADYRDFAEISMAFQRFNDKWFPRKK